MKMKRWFWILAALVLSTAVYFVIRYGLRPKPIPVMNATQFENTEQIGAVIYRRLRTDIRAERIVLLGSAGVGLESNKVWQGLMKAAADDKEKLAYFVLPGVDPVPINPAWETAPFAAEVVREKARMPGGTVLVNGIAKDVSHLVKGSLSVTMDEMIQHPVLSISILPLALDTQSAGALENQCLDATESNEASYRLDCAARRVARRYARKNLDPGKVWAVMERHGLKEYLVFIHLP